MVWITTGKYLYVTQKRKWHKNMFDMKQLSMWQTTANNIQACLAWNSYPCMWQTTANDTQEFLTWNVIHVLNNRKWHTIYVWHETVIQCGKQQQMTHKTFLTWNSWYVANNSKWHTSMFDMKQLSICGKQQQMTHKHFWHETVVHMWQTTANDIQSCLTWNSYPYVANNSKWHTNIFVLKQLSICGKQQLMTYQHVGHETVIHMWQTTANDIQSFLTWNSCPYVTNNSKWHTSIFDMKQLP